jgi:type II secretory pathway pseudopilin PulG
VQSLSPQHGRRDAGETLVEVMLTIVIISLTVTALLSSLGAVGKAGNAQRNGVRADFVLRSYAEATKVGAQTCTVGGTYIVTYAAPTGFVASVTPTGNTCPALATPKLLVLQVTGPQGLLETLQIRIGTP